MNRAAATFALEPAEAADVHRASSEALARQSAVGILGHWVLAAVVLGTTSMAPRHPWITALAGMWVVVVGAGRAIIARAFRSIYPSRPALWSLLFRVGTMLSSVTWGAGGALMVAAAVDQRDAWLVLLTLAGVTAGGITSLSADLVLLRAHIGCLLLPALVAACFIPGSLRQVVGVATVIIAYGAFLRVQAGYAHATFVRALVNAKLLERHATELEMARAESMEASRVKSEFLANMSHEIRTPMTAVIGYADLLLDPSLGPSERVNHVQTVRRNGEHLMSLIDDILDISKIEAGKMTVERIPMSPAQIIVDVASLMRVRAVEKNLSFEIKYLGSIPETIHSDPTRLKQIVMNFVSNAIKFTERGGVRILVRCQAPESPDAQLIIDVADTGIGMTEGQQQKLFRSFVQADASTTRRFGGSGLGLVICKRLGELLGGSISVESSPGRGSVFGVTIPTGSLEGVTMIDCLTEAGLADAPVDASRRIPSLPPSCRVLLAEDGYDNQLLISTYLAKAGAKVKVVADGRLAITEAMAAASAGQSYDVILMDMQMPELDGYGATSKLRLMSYKGPIVALTAHAMAGDRERCEGAGCDEYLTKPVDRAELVATVARFAGVAGSPGNFEAPIVSSYGNDADMQEIVHQFVRDLPDRSSAMLRASQAGETDALKRLAHQLKGAAGGFGFQQITEAAATVERCIADGTDVRMLHGEVERLAALCRRARVN